MDFEATIDKVLASRKYLDYFRQKNIKPVKNSQSIEQDLPLIEVEAKKFASVAEYIYYFMTEGGILVVWSDSINILNFSYSALGNTTLPTHVLAPPFFIILTYEQVLTFFAKGLTNSKSDGRDTLLINTSNQLVYRSHNGSQRTTDMYYYYMDRRGM